MKPVTHLDISGWKLKTIRWLMASAAIMAGVFALAWFTSSPAQAQGGGNTDQSDNNRAPELPDSDNLDFGSYGASHFGIQYYTGSYSKGGVDACTGNSVFDGFAQTSAMSG